MSSVGSSRWRVAKRTHRDCTSCFFIIVFIKKEKPNLMFATMYFFYGLSASVGERAMWRDL